MLRIRSIKLLNSGFLHFDLLKLKPKYPINNLFVEILGLLVSEFKYEYFEIGYQWRIIVYKFCGDLISRAFSTP